MATETLAPDLVDYAEATGLPDHATLYERLTAGHRGLIDPAEQRRLRTAKILVAGCGSIGGAVVEPLIRMGAERLLLADADDYELRDLNRRHAGLEDVGQNKAAVLAVWAAGVNPYAHVEVQVAGVTEETVADVVAGCSVVIDGMDVTAPEALRAKFALHRQARQAGVPVVSGYDIAGVQLVLVYDYRRAGPVFDGKITETDLPDLQPMGFLSRVLPLRALPVGIGDEPFPQVAYNAHLFGVIASQLVLDLLAERPVRRQILVDDHDHDTVHVQNHVQGGTLS